MSMEYQTARDSQHKKLDEFSHTPFYDNVIVTKSSSSYGNYTIKLSDCVFRFFWKKSDADKYAEKFNAS